MTSLTHNTRIETKIHHMDGSIGWEPARIFNRAPKAWGDVPGAGWHRVKFEDGGILCMHEECFRVVDNRA